MGTNIRLAGKSNGHKKYRYILKLFTEGKYLWLWSTGYEIRLPGITQSHQSYEYVT